MEKIVNGVDARLTNACYEAGIDPQGPDAPKSIREAVARFFEDHDASVHLDRDGKIADWPSKRATEEGRLLALCATGHKPGTGRPCLTIADQGEGQTPDSFPNTFLSLVRDNKLRIHFVQGKFNMGGTGALAFCSERHRLQLIVSRRNPALLPRSATVRDQQWGFTIVRRQPGMSGARSSVFTYLAPVGATAHNLGSVLSFSADTWPIFPEDPDRRDDGANAYVRHAPYGSLVKLYEYDWQGVKSNIVQSGEGLLRRIDLALPELALPVRLFECRPYGGGPASFSTNALGLVARLDQDKAENLEPGFPVGASIALGGKTISVRVYAFRPDKAKQYRLNRYGVVLSVNGQMHAALSTDFFGRKAVNLSYIADSLFVAIDCSKLEELMREDLFMNSRDRLRDTSLARRLEEELQQYLKDDPALRALQNRRRAERQADRLKDDKPLADVIQDLLRSNPLLSKLFKHGLRLSAPFPPAAGTGPGGYSQFRGKQFPSFFRFKGREGGHEMEREAHLGSRVRVTFETDAADDYFIRESSPGAWRVRLKVGGEYVDAPDWTATGPSSGVAQLSINWLPEDAVVGSLVEYLIEVTDDSRTDAFQNPLKLTVHPPATRPAGKGTRSLSGSRGRGSLGGGSQLAMPPITPVHEVDWEKHGFDDGTALEIKLGGSSDEDDDTDVYDFYVNVDNRYLRTAQKETNTDPNLLEKQFMYGMVLIGLALLQDRRRPTRHDNAEDDAADSTMEKFVATTTRALAPIFLPMLDAIGGLSAD